MRILREERQSRRARAVRAVNWRVLERKMARGRHPRINSESTGATRSGERAQK